MPGKVDAFAFFGVHLKNDRWSWSGRTPDGEVVLGLWADEFDFKAKPVTYSSLDSPMLERWRHRPGNRERIADLRHARDHFDGRFKVVMLKAIDPSADPRETERADPKPGMVMRIAELDEATGAFSAVLVETPG